MDFIEWIKVWRQRYQAKDLNKSQRKQFTEDVMHRVHQLQEQPQPVIHPWRLHGWFPRLGFGLAVAAAACATFMLLPQSATPPLTQIAQTDIRADVAVLEVFQALDVELLADDVALLDEIVDEIELIQLAQEAAETTWVDQTLQILEEFDADLGIDEFEDELILEELDLLDESYSHNSSLGRAKV